MSTQPYRAIQFNTFQLMFTPFAINQTEPVNFNYVHLIRFRFRFGKWNNIVEQKPICRHIDGCTSVNFTFVAIWPTAYIRYNASFESCTWNEGVNVGVGVGVKSRYGSTSRPFSFNWNISIYSVFSWTIMQQLLTKCPHFARFNYASWMRTQCWVGIRHYTVLWFLCDFAEHASNRKNDKFYAVLHTFLKYYYQLLGIRCEEIAF